MNYKNAVLFHMTVAVLLHTAVYAIITVQVINLDYCQKMKTCL
jgi:hypothetical protein